MHTRMEEGRLYSMPASGLRFLPSLAASLQAPAAPLTEQSRISAADLEPETDALTSLSDNQLAMQVQRYDPQRDISFLRVNSSKIGRHRVLQLPAAAGKPFQPTDLSVTLHAFQESSGGSCYVDVQPSAACGIASANSIFSVDAVRDMVTLYDGLQSWSTCRALSYRLPGMNHMPGVEELLAQMMTKGAFQGSSRDKHVMLLKSDAVLYPAAMALQTHGYVYCAFESNHEAAFHFTERAMQQVVPMHEVCLPKPVFPDADTLLALSPEQLRECTSWELSEILRIKVGTFRSCRKKWLSGVLYLRTRLNRSN